MHQIKNLSILLFMMLLLFSCIKPYYPVIDSKAENKYVVSGRVTNIAGWQEVDVSLSSPIESPANIPLSDCHVQILDNKGHTFSMEEYKQGQYRVWMAQESLIPGTSYKVVITTPAGENLMSGFDTMPKGPQLDSVYYAIKDILATNPERYIRAMQFYVDLNATGDYSRFYKWEVMETWEYHAAHAFEYYYDGDWHKIDPPDSSNLVCWSSGPVKNIFTISTKNLSQNNYKQFPLHYIDGNTSRLGILYSILVSQFALSEKAYNYWEQLRINSNDQGGLYEKQPLAIKGNLQNVSNPEKVVLGYFYAASESARRLYYHDIEGIELDFSNECVEESLGMKGWKEFLPDDYPVYYYYPATWYVRILNRECIDCRLLGGTNVKPDFWPN